MQQSGIEPMLAIDRLDTAFDARSPVGFIQLLPTGSSRTKVLTTNLELGINNSYSQLDPFVANLLAKDL